MNLFRVANIKVDNNIFFGAFQIGVRLDFAAKVIFTNNFVGFTAGRELSIEADGQQPDKTTCAAFGTYTNSPTPLTGLVNTNNIFAGCISYGINAPGAKCGTSKTQTTFRDNVAHSVGGGRNGIGAAIIPDSTEPTSGDCVEVSHFAAYKCV